MTEPRASQRPVDDLFDRRADFWADVYSAGSVEGIVYRERLDRTLRIVERLALSAGAQVLEVGCGAGDLAVGLAHAGHDVTATDTVEAMLERARQRADGEGISVRLLHADAHSLPFPDASFDLVVALGVIPWLHSPGDAMREVARVLRQGGSAIVSADNAWRLNDLFDPLTGRPFAPARVALRKRLHSGAVVRPQRHRRGEVVALLVDAGLQPEESHAIGFGPFTFLGRPILPNRAGLAVQRRLQAWADRGVPVVRGAAVHQLVFAKKTAS